MNDLETILRETVATRGAISVAEYMELCLLHPAHGYYATRDPLGRAGDFITAPEISQMFGELIGLALAQAWLDQGAPSAFTLAELGPGRGTLMADILRCAKNAMNFAERISVHLVETSPALRRAQEQRLAAYNQPRWHDDVSSLPDDAPLLIVANEFFDALPIRQAVMTERGWHERVVALDGDTLIFAARPLPRAALPIKPVGSIVEFSPARDAVMREICQRLQKQGGFMIVVDYGHAMPDASGDTFQAVRAHRYVSPLEDVGDADLTSHVDFARLGAIATQEGCAVLGPTSQKDYLEGLGIQARLEALMGLNPGNTGLPAGVARLTDAKGMGGLFKVMGVAAQVSYCRLSPAGLRSPCDKAASGV